MQGKVFETSAETSLNREQPKRALAEYPPPALQRQFSANTPTGFRRLTPGLLQADRAAAAFDGLPEGTGSHGELLAAVKAAAPQLGLPVALVHMLDWLFRFTRPQDWAPGGRPIVWPSSALQQDALGLSKSQVQALNRGLINTGLVSMKDSPNGKRYGIRDRQGRIVEAYGFDLSPLATRHVEFVQLAAEAKAERVLIGRLRRRATIARKGIAQILETAAEYGFEGEVWQLLRHDTQRLVASLRRLERPEEITIGVGSLERRQTEARVQLEQLLDAVRTKPKGPENNPHTIPTNPDLDPEQDTVMADEGGRSPPSPAVLDPQPQNGRAEAKEARACGENGADSGPATEAEPKTGQATEQKGASQISPAPQTDCGPMMRLSADELTRLAPRLRPYLTAPSPTWPEIVEAADWLRGELGISKSLWGEACVAMGREQAATAVAIVSVKPAGHFRTSPGGYFHGMVAKAKLGQLNLAQTIWGLRTRGKPPGSSSPRRRID
jgi:replication initiation protein RepC